MIEAVGAVIVMSMVVRLNSLMDTKVADTIFAGIRIWLPPSRDDIEGTKAVTHKRSKGPPKNRSIEEKVNLLGLRQRTFPPGTLAQQPLWELLDTICLAVLLAVVSMVWQWVQTVAHPEERLLDVSGWVVFSACCLSLYTASSVCPGETVDYGLSKWERKAFAFSLGVLIAAIILALPSGTTTFSLDQALAEVTRQAQAWQEFIGLKSQLPDPSGPVLLLLSLLCAVLAAVLINPAFQASYTYVHQGRLRRDSPLTHKLLVLEPFLCLFISLTFFRPMLLGPLQTKAVFRPCPPSPPPGGAPFPCNSALPSQLGLIFPPSDDGWLQYQVLLMMAFLGIRAMLTRWQVQAYMEYGPIEYIYTQYAHRELDVAPIQNVFHTRLQSAVYVGLQFLAPAAWLTSLLLLFASKVFMPTWTPQVIHYIAPLAKRPEPLALNGSVIDVLKRGNLTASLGWDLAVAVIDFPLVSGPCYREVMSFLTFWTVTMWFACFTVAVFYRLWAMSKINLAAITGAK